MIQEEAHDEANIIFGSVIDENMTDEIRITVIATGFGEDREDRKPVPVNANANTNVANITSAPQRNKKVVHLGTIVDDLDTPTWQRKKQGSEETETVTLNKGTFQFGRDKEEEDEYDIPTFLRRQMD
jgi:cell division protein FtsZ